MNEVVYCGIKLYTDASYFKFTEGDHASIVTDDSKYTVEVTFPKGIYSKELGELLSLQVTDNMEVRPSSTNGAATKIYNVTVSLNGLEMKKMTSDPHVIRLVIVDDHPSRVVQNYSSTTIVGNVKDINDPEFLEYVFSNLKYFKVKSSRSFDWKNYKFRNFPKITIYDKSLTLTSENTYVNKLRYNHNQYLIRAIDYETQFFHDISIILEKFGVQLTRINREETLESTSYVAYSINQTPVKYNHPRYSDVQEMIMCHSLFVDFTLSTPDMVLYFDFKNRYNNVDLLTNYAEFKTKDKYGTDWTAAIKWGPITEEFNHTYGQDNNANFANQCNFRAELYFYEVYDANYSYIEEIVTDLKHLGMWEKFPGEDETRLDYDKLKKELEDRNV